MEANQIECSRLEQRSVIKFMVMEKCKPCEIYRRMCDVYEKAIFSKKNCGIIALAAITEAGIYRELSPLILPAANHSPCNDMPACAQWDAP